MKKIGDFFINIILNMKNILFLIKKYGQTWFSMIYYKTIHFSDTEIFKMDYELLQKREPTLEEQVYEILKKLSIPIVYKGHKYLLEAIQTAVREPEKLSSINKNIFPQIAEAYNTTVSCVESAIRSAITRAWESGDPEVQKHYFGRTVPFGSGRPSDTEFIATIANMPEMRKFK